MSRFRTLPMNHTDSHLAYVSFATRDGKGREVGTHVHTYEVEFVAVPEAQAFYTREPGHYFGAEVHATRGQVAYGAAQPAQMFTTRAARDLYLEKYLAGARKRALTNFPPARTCQLCGEPKPADRSCDCCDNHCQ